MRHPAFSENALYSQGRNYIIDKMLCTSETGKPAFYAITGDI